ncbi:MAG: hypothetical protein NT007_12245 [Candidatus Kapabacteria bacterium]|nr:hypothetical protein [Candidatus Kapabacteria bacterium]
MSFFQKSSIEAVSKASFLSFLRMHESPKVGLEGDSCIRTNDSLQVGNDITSPFISIS